MNERSFPALRRCPKTSFVRNCTKHRKILNERELPSSRGLSIVSSLLRRQRSDVKRLSGKVRETPSRGSRNDEPDYGQNSSHLRKFFLRLIQPKNNLRNLS
jgi:hypothetical protein